MLLLLLFIVARIERQLRVTVLLVAVQHLHSIKCIFLVARNICCMQQLQVPLRRMLLYASLKTVIRAQCFWCGVANAVASVSIVVRVASTLLLHHSYTLTHMISSQGYVPLSLFRQLPILSAVCLVVFRICPMHF